MDTDRHKEAVLKVRIQSWINEAFTITEEIEGKLTHMQGMHILMHRSTLDIEVLEQHMQQIQEAAAQCATNLAAVQTQLEGLCAKISTLTK